MTGWTMSITYFLIMAFLILMFVAGLVVTIVRLAKKKRCRIPIIFSSSFLGMSLIAGLFIGSHSTYFRFNDWFVMGGKISEIVKKYGEPDIWRSDETGLKINVEFQNSKAVKKEPSDIWQFNAGKSGKVGYYIYNDQGHIMSDGLPHYYYIEYDEDGVVTEIYDGSHPGG